MEQIMLISQAHKVEEVREKELLFGSEVRSRDRIVVISLMRLMMHTRESRDFFSYGSCLPSERVSTNSSCQNKNRSVQEQAF